MFVHNRNHPKMVLFGKVVILLHINFHYRFEVGLVAVHDGSTLYTITSSSWAQNEHVRRHTSLPF